MKKSKITMLIILTIIIVMSLVSGFFIKKNYQGNEYYDKTEFKISDKYSVKIPKKLAFKGTSGNVIYRFKTLNSRNTLRKEIEELYNSCYKNLEKYDNDGYKLYYDEINNITIGYKIDVFGISDLLLIVREGLE